MQTWFITGTSSGIGRQLTETLLERGDRVVATLRVPDRLDDLRSAYPDRLSVEALDVRDRANARRVLARTFALGRIDVVVNNAGYGLFGAVEELGDDDIDAIVATNFIGSMNVVRAALPHLRAQGGGRIVQISSEGGQTTYPGFGAYHATKWGIEGFIETVASEVAAFGIRCSIVEFGPTDTNFRASLVTAEATPAYRETAVGKLRQDFAAGTSFTQRANARDVVGEMLARLEGDAERLVIGRYAVDRVSAALRRRLAAVERPAVAT